jgi:hypothetical protein
MFPHSTPFTGALSFTDKDTTEGKCVTSIMREAAAEGKRPIILRSRTAHRLLIATIGRHLGKWSVRSSDHDSPLERHGH